MLVFLFWVLLLTLNSCHPRERGDPFVVATQVFTKNGFPRSRE